LRGASRRECSDSTEVQPGHVVKERWVLGIYETSVRRDIVLYVCRSDRQTLLPLIRDYGSECLTCFHKHGCGDGMMRKDLQHIILHTWLQSCSDCDRDGIQTCWGFFLHGRNLGESAKSGQHGNYYSGLPEAAYNLQMDVWLTMKVVYR
ncbi:hypothetical protein C0J52_12493, partial [Blattella germanica]